MSGKTPLLIHQFAFFGLFQNEHFNCKINACFKKKTSNNKETGVESIAQW
jgi:hypothetical protein